MSKVSVNLGKRTTFEGIISVDPTSVQLRTNSKSTEFRLIPVKVVYPDGSEDSTEAQLFENSRLANVDTFVAGAKVELLVQVDGQYAGYAQIQLPTRKRLDVSKATNVWDYNIEVEQDAVLNLVGGDKEPV